MHFIRLVLFLLLTAPVYGQRTPADSVAARPAPVDLRQTDFLGRGRWHIGLDASAGLAGGYVGFRGLVVPRVQYFVRDGWSVGVEARVDGRNGTGFGSLSSYTGVGLSSRYYFVRDRRLAVFGQAGATVGLNRFLTAGRADSFGQTIRQEQVGPATQFTTGLGLHYGLSRRWAVEAVAEQSLTRYSGLYNYNVRGSLGVVYRLGR
jgi:hypothetical protein